MDPVPDRRSEWFVPQFGPLKFRLWIGLLFLPYTGMVLAFTVIGGMLAETTSAQFTMLTAGVGIVVIATVAMIARRQILSLRIGSDGISADAVPEAAELAA